MPTYALRTAFLLQLFSVAAAQAPGELPRPATKAPVFTLPAGEHGLTELVNLLGQIRKCEIECAVAELEHVDREKVVLQRELQLEAAAFEDVVTTLLFYRGLVVVPGDHAGRQRAIAMLDRVRLHDSAVERTNAEILARPSRLEFATTTLPTDPSQLELRLNVLRPFFTAPGRPQPWAMTMENADRGIRFTGSTEQLVFALKTAAVFDGTEPEPSPAIAWPPAALPWPGGKMSLTTFLKLFSTTLDANLIGHAADLEVDLGPPAQLTAAAWWSRATMVLRSIDQAIVPVVPSNRVFLLRALRERGLLEIQWRAAFEAPEALLQATAIVPVMTVHECKHVDLRTAMLALRPAFGRAGGTLTVATPSPSGLLFAGLRDDVAKALQLVREADRPK
jgi:hypothetical protein